MFYIVEFPSDLSCEIAPDNWVISGNKCLWPPMSETVDLQLLIRRKVTPDKNWGEYDIRILGTAETFGEAFSKCKKAENDDSDLTSDPDNYGRGKPRAAKRKKSSYNITYEGMKRTNVRSEESDDEEMANSNSANRILQMLPSPPTPKNAKSSHTTPTFTHSDEIQSSQPSISIHLAEKATKYDQFPRCSSQPATLSRNIYTPERYRSDNEPQTCIEPSTGIQSDRSHMQPERLRIDSQADRLYSSKRGEPSTPVVPKKDGLAKYIFRELNILRANQEKILDMLGILIERNSNAPLQQASQSKLVQVFPVTSIAEMDELESAVADSICEKELLIKWKSFGGSNFGDHARRILRHLFTDSLAESYSWLGNRDKRRFSSLKLSQIIIDAVIQTNNVTRNQVEDSIKNWLRHAKERKEYKKNVILKINNCV